jgi:ribosomal protein S27AE
MTKKTKKCPSCGKGPFTYVTFQRHWYKNHYKPKKKKKDTSTRWKRPKRR